MQKEISVIIVTYNSEKHIFDCLESLFKYNDIGDALEVIIVDNQSESFDETKAKLESQYGSRVIIIENDKNGGYGQGNNVGIRASSAPIIMIMNPDVRLVEPLFKSAIKAFDKPDVVQYGVRAINKEGKQYVSMGISAHINPLVRMPIFTVCNRMGWFFPRIMYLVGACFFIRKTSFEEIGLFDERIFMYGEEDDIHYRLLKKHNEWKVIYNHKLSYAHLHGLYSVPVKDNSFYEIQAKKVYEMLLSERGLTKEQITKYNIMVNRIRLFKARLYSVFNQKNKEEINRLRSNIRHLKDGNGNGKDSTGA